MKNSPGINAQFIRVAARMIKADMTQSDYDKLREVAEMLNPNKLGYVKSLNNDVKRKAPFIKTRD